MVLKNGRLLFEITNACNLDCIHCYKENLGGKQLSLEQIKIIVDKITAFGVKSLILTGGEPLLRKDFFEIIDYAVNCEIEDVVINTNGVLLSNSQIIREIRKRLDIIEGIPVSFDGANKITHDYIRGKGEFAKLMKILKKNSLDDFPFVVNVTIGQWNYNDFDDFFTLYDKLDARGINFGIFLPLGKGKQLQDQVLTSTQCRSLIERSKRKLEEGYDVELCSVPYANLFAKDLSGACCNVFTEYITISAAGNVVPCILYDFNCGSILEMELDEIFSNPLVEFFRDPKKMQEKMSGHCNTCTKFELCRGGCKLLTYALKGSIYYSDPLCPLAEQKE